MSQPTRQQFYCLIATPPFEPEYMKDIVYYDPAVPAYSVEQEFIADLLPEAFNAPGECYRLALRQPEEDLNRFIEEHAL